MGSASVVVIYFFLIVSSVFIPSYVIERLTAKWTIVASMLCYSGYILGQFYPSYATLVRLYTSDKTPLVLQFVHHTQLGLQY